MNLYRWAEIGMVANSLAIHNLIRRCCACSALPFLASGASAASTPKHRYSSFLLILIFLASIRLEAAPIQSTSVEINQLLNNSNAIVSQLISLPDILSLQSVSIELAHAFRGDVRIELFAPNQDLFSLVRGGTFDSSRLGDGLGVGLANVVSYRFQEPEEGLFGAWGGNGPYSAVSWHNGAYAAGEWRLRIEDTFPSFDHGAVGTVMLEYIASGDAVSVPEPSSFWLMFVALMGLGLVRARNRSA